MSDKGQNSSNLKKVSNKSLNNISGGYEIYFDDVKKRWMVSGIMKKDGRSNTHLHRCVAAGHRCTTYFNTEREAENWAEEYLY